ncbi:MAG TPA: NHL repeat-containing protein, partial [Thermoanaerobaculia bacterium]|nr:NHL repeat-containing protein [Thermoanaerobaculia bacterium]
DGNFYVCSERTSTVLRYDGKTGALRGTFVPSGSGGLDICEYPAFGADGDLYVSSTHANAVFRYDGTTGASKGAFVPARSGGLDTPSGIVFGPDGNLYVSSTETHQVLRYDGRTGAFLGAFVPAGSGGLEKPVGLTFGPDGQLYVSSLFTHQVLRYDGRTGAFVDIFVPARSGGLNGPYGLAFGPDGNLYVVSISSSQVLRYRGSDGAFLGAFHTGLPLFFPTYLLFTPPAAPACEDDATHLCLAGGRFRVEVAWQTPDGNAGAGQAVRLTADSAYFWFFSPGNVEMIIKVLDGCGLNRHYWVFAGGLTNVATTLTVTDTRSGAVKTYRNPQGTAFAPLQDTAAFATCP